MWHASMCLTVVVGAVISLPKVHSAFRTQVSQIGGDDLPCAQFSMHREKVAHYLQFIFLQQLDLGMTVSVSKLASLLISIT